MSLKPARADWPYPGSCWSGRQVDVQIPTRAHETVTLGLRLGPGCCVLPSAPGDCYLLLFESHQFLTQRAVAFEVSRTPGDPEDEHLWPVSPGRHQVLLLVPEAVRNLQTAISHILPCVGPETKQVPFWNLLGDSFEWQKMVKTIDSC